MRSLQEHFLIAMPAMADPNFRETVTYVCKHDADGAFGIILNRPGELSVAEMLAQLALPLTDRARLDRYLTNVEEVERRIRMVEQRNTSGDARELPDAPAGVPDSFAEHMKLMFDLQVLALQTDMTRVIAFKTGRDSHNRVFPESGSNQPFHPASHHQNNADRLETLTKINTYHVSLVAHLLERLKSTPNGDGNLLDHSLVLYGSGMSNSNIHNHSPLPVIVAGGAAGRLKGGRHLSYPENTPMSNLLLSILHKAGIEQESVGDSTGPLTEL